MGDKYVIERNVVDYFDKTKRVSNYWAPLNDKYGRMVGAVALQFDISKLERILPSESLKMPYPAAYISVWEY
jgi:hypothetical protein